MPDKGLGDTGVASSSDAALAAGDIVVAIDQGTSSTKAIALDRIGRLVASASVPLEQSHPQPGWVQQDARQLLASVRQAMTEVAVALGDLRERVAAVALSNQRESALVWSTVTGEPLGPVLGWQDRRTIAAAQEIAAAGHAERVREITGLPLDPMFSALKFAWLLDEIDPDRSRSRAGEIALGTVDSFILFALTGEHRIELGNASRTQLLDLTTLGWSDELLSIFRIPREALPPIVSSIEPSGPLRGVDALPPDTRIRAVLGDSHAALFGHGARASGVVKVTLGTGSSIMGLLPAVTSVPVGSAITSAPVGSAVTSAPVGSAVTSAPATPAPTAPAGLVTTVAWGAPDARLAFEGNILSSGSTVTWLADLFGIAPTEVFALAATVPLDPHEGVDLVPAFAGLGAPWWNESARAVLTGFDLGSGRAQLARAAVESIALQIEDVLSAAEADRERIDTIVIDGAPAANDELAQLLADLTQRRVARPSAAGLSALGAAHLAGIAAGVFTDDDVLAFNRGSTVFTPQLSPADAAARRARWLEAVGLARASTHHPLSTKESTS